jgi:hypothetical protein
MSGRGDRVAPGLLTFGAMWTEKIVAGGLPASVCPPSISAEVTEMSIGLAGSTRKVPSSSTSNGKTH